MSATENPLLQALQEIITADVGIPKPEGEGPLEDAVYFRAVATRCMSLAAAAVKAQQARAAAQHETMAALRAESAEFDAYMASTDPAELPTDLDEALLYGWMARACASRGAGASAELLEALDKLAQYPQARADEMDAAGMRRCLREILAAECVRQAQTKMRPSTPVLNIIFDGPPGPDGPRFIEVEDQAGNSIETGEWFEVGDGCWCLRLRAPAPPELRARLSEVEDEIAAGAMSAAAVLTRVRSWFDLRATARPTRE